MVQTLSKPLRLEEFLKLPQTKPAREYIDGKIIQKPIPQGKHSTIQGELVTTINAGVKSQRIARAFPELRCTFGGRSTVPDVSVFTLQRIPRNKKGKIANVFQVHPDWTIEILSPELSQTRVTKNILHCLEYGTQMGWLIDPGEETVLVYIPKQEMEMYDEPGDRLPVPPFASEYVLTVGDLFAWLLE